MKWEFRCMRSSLSWSVADSESSRRFLITSCGIERALFQSPISITCLSSAFQFRRLVTVSEVDSHDFVAEFCLSWMYASFLVFGVWWLAIERSINAGKARVALCDRSRTVCMCRRFIVALFCSSSVRVSAGSFSLWRMCTYVVVEKEQCDRRSHLGKLCDRGRYMCVASLSHYL